MATIVYPTGRTFVPVQFSAELRTNVLISTSPLTGAVDTREVPGARWVFTLTYNNQTLEEQARREAFYTQVGGQANRISIWHQMRPAPRGTLRGSPTLASAAASGATTASIAGSGNLKAGDMLAIGNQLVQVIEDTTALSSVKFRPALRAGAAAGSPVTWDRPRASFILTSPGVAIPYAPKHGTGFLVELMEVFG
jgi:hypothetical protein